MRHRESPTFVTRMGNGKRRKAGALGAAVFLALAAAHPAQAADGPRPAGQLAQANAAVMSFDIPAQPLSAALTVFSTQSGLQIAADTAVVSGLTSPGVSGDKTPSDALSALLAGTGVTWRFVGSDAVVLEQAPARAGGGAAAPMVLAPIMVAGEKVDRSIMETSASVSVFTGETIDSRPSVTGTNAVTEGVSNMVTIEPSNNAPVIRGVGGAGPATGAVAFFAGTRPRTTLQIDGRPASFNEMIFGDASLWDVEQTEVFRGPQSTVQGRNSIAGAIVVKTKDPTYYPEGKVRVMAGNHDSRRYAAMLSGPIIEDQLAMRVSVDRSTSTSELGFEPYAGENDPEDYQSLNLRGKVLVEPAGLEGFRGLLTVNRTNYEGPQAEYVVRPFTADGDPQSVNVATFNPRTTSGILDLSYEIDDSLTATALVSVTDFNVRRHSVPATGNVWIDGMEFVAEPRLAFSGLDHRLTGFGGYYGLTSWQDEYIDLSGGNDYSDKTKTHAVFGEATYAVVDWLDLTAGLRLESENRRRVGGAGRFAVNFDETYDVFLPKMGVTWHVDDTVSFGALVSRGYNGGGAGVTFAAPFVAYTYDPEFVWNYELNGRAELLDGTLRLTGNVFYADYTDMQLPYVYAVSSTVIRNADQMSIADIEKEIGRLGKAARDGKLGMADMQGGTFTISNGGVYGSLMSSPILNAPQSGILGMHKIQERPMAIGGQVVIRPMMYLALSYDHRIVDGKEAVTFLVRVKESLEDPERLVLDL